MTNEQLAEFIQEGDSDLKPVLWERVKKLLYMFSRRYYSRYADYCERCGVTEWDLKQQAYTAYENSFAGYSRSRGAYNTYLTFMFKTSLRELFKSKDPLNTADSLDRLIDTEDEGGGTVGDFLPDLNAEEPFEEIEESSVYSVVHKAVAELPEKERDVIHRTYFEGQKQKDIAADYGVSVQYVSDYSKKALNLLRKNNAIRRLGDELGYTSQRAYSNTLSSFKRCGMSGVERVAIGRTDLQSWFDRSEAARERLLAGGSFEEYEKTMAEIGARPYI